ncbi:Squamosa promoter-binding-like protein [Castilleja foliolosa]|uniref:Squamosa promoter-binding-like protein n=1 Tax=Castilleja foliolosa TaxID=1961234 RepID=A0ABD3D951_9LAMI
MEGVGMIGGWFFQICFGVGNDSWPMKKKHSLLVLEEQSADFHSMAHSTEWIHSIECFLFGRMVFFTSLLRATRSGPVQGPRCQVEGCRVDLSDAKAYYSRHKVCVMHSKSPKEIVAGLEQRFCQQCSSSMNCLNSTKENEAAVDVLLATMSVVESHSRDLTCCLLAMELFVRLCLDNEGSKTGGFVMDFSAYPSLAGRDLFPNPTSERGLTTNNQAAITGKFQLPFLSNDSTNPLSDLLTSRPSYSRPVVYQDSSFNIGVSDSSNALSLLSNLPCAGPKVHLGPNSFLGQPSDNPPPGSAVGQYVCYKGNRDNSVLHEMRPDWGLNDQYNNGGLGLGQPSEGLQFYEMDQTRGYDSSPSVQHNMHW